MQPVKLLSRWLPLVALATASALSWRVAQANDTEDEALDPIEYSQQLSTPVLSARRLPRTLQAPIAEQAVEPVVDEIATRATETSCFVVAERPTSQRRPGQPDLVPRPTRSCSPPGPLSLLDPATTFTTEVRFSNTLDTGVLNGDLYLVGGGDPFLVTANWLDPVRR
ncbi:MAG: D-alanyl-D-alanine carboxypeptidase [Acidimicrobiales bacterium]